MLTFYGANGVLELPILANFLEKNAQGYCICGLYYRRESRFFSFFVYENFIFIILIVYFMLHFHSIYHIMLI